MSDQVTPVPKTPTIRCFCDDADPSTPSYKPGDVMAYACDEDGVTLATHYCSGPWWAQQDIMDVCHHDKYRARYPDGFQLEWIGNPPTDWKDIPAPPAARSSRVGDCPLEQRLALAMDAAGVEYWTDHEGAVPENLDFFLPEVDVFIEVKGGHSPRISGQMSRATNVIAVQGRKATEMLASLFESSIR